MKKTIKIFPLILAIMMLLCGCYGWWYEDKELQKTWVGSALERGPYNNVFTIFLNNYDGASMVESLQIYSEFTKVRLKTNGQFNALINDFNQEKYFDFSVHTGPQNYKENRTIFLRQPVGKLNEKKAVRFVSFELTGTNTLEFKLRLYNNIESESEHYNREIIVKVYYEVVLG